MTNEYKNISKQHSEITSCMLELFTANVSHYKNDVKCTTACSDIDGLLHGDLVYPSSEFS